MKAFDIFKQVLKNSLRVVWVCLIIALLFAIVLYVNLVRGDLLDSFYDEIISEAGNGTIKLTCNYSPANDYGDTDIGIYFSKSGLTYDVTVSCENGGQIAVTSYARGLNICVPSLKWQNKLSGSKIQTGVNGVWIYKTYADSYGISIGQSVTITGDSTNVYTVLGTYTATLTGELCTGYTPAFLIAEDTAFESAVIVVNSSDVYSLYLTDFGKTITDSDGIIDLCRGYFLAETGFTVLFFIFCVIAFLLSFRVAYYALNSNSMQTFLFSVFGMNKPAQFALYFALLTLFGIVSLILSIGVFYAFAGVTQALSKSIMNMVFTEITPGICLIYAFLGYLLSAALATVFHVKKDFGQGGR